MCQGPLTLIDEGYKTYGEAFTVPVLHKKITFLIGPDVGPHFYKATDADMSQEEVGPCLSWTWHVKQSAGEF